MCRKTGLNLDLTGLGAERDFKEYISLLASTLEPSVVFDYFPPDDEDTAVIGSDSASRNPSTIAILTLGSPFADRTAAEKEDTARLIGHRGIIANALREVVGVAGKSENKRVHIKFESFEDEKVD